MKIGRVIEVAATGLHVTGAGIGHTDDTPVHVRDLLPGEQARAQIVHVSRHRPRTAWARIVERVGEPAAERARPVCPHFAECGGCAWQHLAYPAQLVHKRERVARTLADHGLGDVEVAPAIGAPAIVGYRNVGKYVVGPAPDKNAPVVLGSYAPRSHRLVDTTGCQVVEPVIDQVRARAGLALRHLPVYDERTRTGWLRYVTARSGVDGRVLVAIVTSGAADRSAVAAGAAELFADNRVSGVVWVRNDRESAIIIDGENELLCGQETVRERIAGIDIEVGVSDFMQVNRAQTARLYGEVARLACWANNDHDDPRVALDVYCGVGGIAFTLAGLARERSLTRTRVHGIERNPLAIGRAEQAARRAGLAETITFQTDEASAMANLAADLVVVNPPRKGLDEATRTAVLRLAPARVVYVSCGPESLARDLAILASDYRITGVSPIDLMPGTPQIETVVGLHRRRKPYEPGQP